MNHYLLMLQHVHANPQTFQSNHFRGNAGYYAEAASRGHISALDNGVNTGMWRITSNGMQFIQALKGA